MKRFMILIVAMLMLIGVIHANGKMEERYYKRQEGINQSFSEYYYTNFDLIYGLDAPTYLHVMDSLQADFDSLIVSFREDYPDSHQAFFDLEKQNIRYSFDNFIVMYPYYHQRIAGTGSLINDEIEQRLENDIAKINHPALLANESFRDFTRSYLYIKTKIALVDPAYQKSDNQQLKATLDAISQWIDNREVAEYYNTDYLRDHIDRFGIKNIDAWVDACPDSAVHAMYEQERMGREGHRIETYKTVDGFDLDLHIFLPEQAEQSEKHPAMVYFHGGSWTEGKPDWSFPACGYYAKKGWIGIAVEYRISQRHGSLPFESVMDAKSAIRWLRSHAEELNLDADSIVVSGNSAGGHLAMACAMVENWNDPQDDLRFNSVPDLILINSGVYDLTDVNNWIRQGLRERGKDEELVREISPLYLVREKLPPMLIIHGEQDRNISFQSASTFAGKMTQRGNQIEFHAIPNANHFIWFGPYAQQVASIRKAFLKKHGYE